MNRDSRKTFLILIILSLAYFLIFVFPNFTGAKDVNMLSVFEHDEFAQYPNVIHMITPGETLFQTLHNFFVYQHYYYGFPFYFFSALSILPVKLLAGSQWQNLTSVIVLVLRQMISVLPMIIAVLLLVFATTRYRSRYKSIFLTLFLFSIPGVVSNNMWWHPDSLLVLFSALTIFFLAQDDFRFGRNFFFSAITCGLAIGAKMLGVLFVLTYAVYILYGFFSHKISFLRMISRTILYLLLLFAAVIITNPLLLLPIERAEIIATFKSNLAENTVGFWIKGNSGTSMVNQVYAAFSDNFTNIGLLIAALAAVVYGIIRKSTLSLSLVILTWGIGYIGYFLIFASTLRPHYLLPAVLPILSSLAYFLPESIHLGNINAAGVFSKAGWTRIGLAVVLIATTIQMGLNINQDVKNVAEVLHREENSASINMYRQAEQGYLIDLKLDRKIRIYRDWRAYVPESNDYAVFMSWDLATYEDIQQLHPDVLFLERDNMVFFSDPSKIAVAIDPARMRAMESFYSDAINDHLEGYSLILKTDFGSVFVSNLLFEEYFRK